MSLLDYIKGHRKGENAHSLEKQAMTDSFLAEALEGFEAVNGDHMAHISSIKSKIAQKELKRTVRRGRLWSSITAAAVVIFIGIAASVLFFKNQEHNVYAESSIQYPIDLYLPDNIYEDNIAVIAKINTELTKNISVVVSDIVTNRKNKNEIEEVKERIDISPIDIPLPNGEKG